MKLLSLFSAALFAALLPASATAQEAAAEAPVDELSERTAQFQKIDALLTRELENRKKQFAEDSQRYFLSKGILADKQTRSVVVDAYTTGIKGNELCEFFAITFESGHDYEALFQLPVKGDALRKAFDFIGMPPGRPIDYDVFRFCSAGERMNISVAQDGQAEQPLTDFIWDKNTNAPHKNQTFVYIGGSYDEKNAFLPDQAGPGSVISAYNEKFTLFDVPRAAQQDAVYENNISAPDINPEAFVHVRLTFTPEKRPPRSPLRVRDCTLFFPAEGGVKMDQSPDVQPLADAVKQLRSYAVERQQSVYLTLRWDDGIPLKTLKENLTLLQLLDTSDLEVYVDKPPEGFPYYKAFFPQESWRKREDRFSQPVELHVSANAQGGTSVSVTRIVERWEGEALKPELSIHETPDVSVAAFLEELKKQSPSDPNVLFVFAPGSLPYAAIRPYLDAARATHPVIQIFVD